MNDHSQERDPSAQEFRFSLRYRGALYFGVLFFGVGFVMCLCMPWFEKTPSPPFLNAGLAALLGCFTALMLFGSYRLGSRVVVDRRGISQYLPFHAPKSFEWNQIARVNEHQMAQEMVLQNHFADRIRIEHHLDGFPELLQIIITRVPATALGGGESAQLSEALPKTFYPPRGPTIFFILMGIGFLWYGSYLIPFGIGVLLLAFLSRKRVTVDAEFVETATVLRKHRLPLLDITGISVDAGEIGVIGGAPVALTGILIRFGADKLFPVPQLAGGILQLRQVLVSAVADCRRRHGLEPLAELGDVNAFGNPQTS